MTCIVGSFVTLATKKTRRFAKSNIFLISNFCPFNFCSRWWVSIRTWTWMKASSSPWRISWKPTTRAIGTTGVATVVPPPPQADPSDPITGPTAPFPRHPRWLPRNHLQVVVVGSWRRWRKTSHGWRDVKIPTIFMTFNCCGLMKLWENCQWWPQAGLPLGENGGEVVDVTVPWEDEGTNPCNHPRKDITNLARFVKCHSISRICYYCFSKRVRDLSEMFFCRLFRKISLPLEFKGFNSWAWGQMICFLVVSNMFYFHPYVGKIPISTHIFQMGWNSHLVLFSRIVFGMCSFLLITPHNSAGLKTILSFGDLFSAWVFLKVLEIILETSHLSTGRLPRAHGRQAVFCMLTIHGFLEKSAGNSNKTGISLTFVGTCWLFVLLCFFIVFGEMVLESHFQDAFFPLRCDLWRFLVKRFQFRLQNCATYPSKKLPWQWKIHHGWRCISYWTWGFSNIMLVSRGVYLGLSHLPSNSQYSSSNSHCSRALEDERSLQGGAFFAFPPRLFQHTFGTHPLNLYQQAIEGFLS